MQRTIDVGPEIVRGTKQCSYKSTKTLKGKEIAIGCGGVMILRTGISNVYDYFECTTNENHKELVKK